MLDNNASLNHDQRSMDSLNKKPALLKPLGKKPALRFVRV